MASRLITALLGASLAAVLAVPAAAEEAPGGAPETPVADPAIAAGEAARERVDNLLAGIGARLDRLAPGTAARRPAAFRSVAVQAPDQDETETTTGDDSPPTTQEESGPTTTTGATTTTSPPPPPPAQCDAPDEEAIQAALDAYEVASLDAAAELEPIADELIEGIVAAEAALEAALADARTVEDVEAAFAAARAAVDTFYNGFIAAIGEVKRLTGLAGADTRVALIAACAPQETIDAFMGAVAFDSGTYDLLIEDLEREHADHLAILNAAKRAFLERFEEGPGGHGPDPSAGPKQGEGADAPGAGGSDDGDGGRVPGDAGSGGGGGLPITGLAGLVPLLLSALVLIGLGSATVVAVRRRGGGEAAS